MNRREFSIFSIAAIGCAAGSGVLINKFYEPKLHLRPPGSVKNFESLCIKCGQCVQVCPYHSIDLTQRQQVWRKIVDCEMLIAEK